MNPFLTSIFLRQERYHRIRAGSILRVSVRKDTPHNFFVDAVLAGGEAITLARAGTYDDARDEADKIVHRINKIEDKKE